MACSGSVVTFEVSQDDYLRKVVADREALLAALKVAANLLTLYLPDEQTVGTAFKSKEAKERVRAAIARAETP